jgi:WD40 repeat protein
MEDVMRGMKRYLSAAVALALMACAEGATEPTAVPDLLAKRGGQGGGSASVYTVEVTPAVAEVVVGYTVQLTAVAQDRKGNVLPDVAFSWSSDDPAVAQVSESGIVTGISVGGPVTITASTGGKKPVTGTAVVIVRAISGLIVFDYYDGSNRDIYRINPDGTGLRRLTDFVGGNAHTSNDHPSLSFDRARIVFSREWNVWTMNADGSDPAQLTFTTPNTLPQVSAQWSPDGAKIVWESQFACCTVANREIHTMDADGSNNVRLTSNAIWDGFPAWSPDGAWIVYQSGDPGDIYRMDAAGTNVTRLTNNTAVEHRPIYSPDGSKIVFQSNRDGQWEVYAMNADGSQQTRLTVSPSGGSWYPHWSPDGGRIVFASDRAGSWDLYVMKADGSEVTKLTALASTEVMMPSWR